MRKMRSILEIIELLYSHEGGIGSLNINTLRDMVDFTEFLVETTIQYQRFSPKLAVVGGDIDIALIRQFGTFEWVTSNNKL